jgi:hypothetical protein
MTALDELSVQKDPFFQQWPKRLRGLDEIVHADKEHFPLGSW